MPASRRSDRRERDVVLLAADGTRVSARHDPAHTRGGPADGVPRDVCFVLAHGFTGSWRRADMLRIGAALREHGGVVSFDFRGHGRSTGTSTVGDREVLDLEAAVAWARLLGYRRVVPVGWSMGAGVALRHAAGAGPAGPSSGPSSGAAFTPVDAVVAVSGPSRWQYRGTGPMRLLHLAVETLPGRRVLALLYGTRLATGRWDLPPEPPDAVIGRIAPVPVLLVHGDADRYFPLEHARWLHRAGRPPVELWVEPGFGHAETAATPELVHRIAAWALRAAARPVPSARMPR